MSQARRRSRSPQAPSVKNSIADIESIEAPDDSTLVINLSRPNGGVLPAFSTMAGAVINPRTDELFHARVGGGAHLLTVEDSLPIQVSQVAELGGALLATGFAYDREMRRGQAEIVSALLLHVRDIRRMGAAALDLCHVAAGRVDGYWEQGVRAWDVAAGMLVVTEAGGVVSGASAGSPPSSDLTVATGPALHPVLLGALDGSALG